MTKIIIKELIAEAKRIEEDSIHSAKSQFEASNNWKKINLWLGIPAAIFSGVTGISILNDWSPVIGACLSLFAAALISLITFLNPNQKSNTHLNSGNNYLSLRNKSRFFRNISIRANKDTSILSKKLRLLADERDTLNKSSPQFSRKNFEKARRSIEDGEATYRN